MNKDWSEMNKCMQQNLKKATFSEGIETLIKLRDTLMTEVLSWRGELSREDYDAIPFINADGYHSKTIAYSLWHVFRIEDITVNTLIRKTKQVFFEGGWQEKTGSPIMTTGNELVKNEISDFSKQLDLDALYHYIQAVKEETDMWLRTLEFADLKITFNEEDKAAIKALGVVSPDEKAHWLIDYWCGKNLKGLIEMPMSRHWIMHIEAALRIKNKIGK